MKFSIITPEHTKKNFPFLLELFDSVLDQTYTNWEWILFLNNGLKKKDIPSKIKNNKKVFIYEDENPVDKKIGRIKHEAFSKGTGDVLVELDHDDLLTEDCLEELYKIYSTKPEVGFVYSDNATLDMTGEWIPYRQDYGWESYDFNYKGKTYKAMRSWKPTSHSISQIYFAPDHVRSWRRDIYCFIGGHNPDYHVCDDHELLIRTYLATNMYWIQKPLYLYRITGENTWPQRQEDITNFSWNLFHQYIRDLVSKDCDNKGLLKIDLGGGLNPFSDEYTTVDIRDTADIVADLNKKFPLEDNSVGLLHTFHTLEHLKDPLFSMREIYRVLAHGGWAFIEVPSTDGRGAWQDPTHVSFWNKNSFWYYTDKRYSDFVDSGVRFQIYKLSDYFPDSFMQENKILVTCAVLIAIKNDDERFPGPLNI